MHADLGLPVYQYGDVPRLYIQEEDNIKEYPCYTRKMTAAEWDKYGKYNSKITANITFSVGELISMCCKSIDKYGVKAKLQLKMRMKDKRRKYRLLFSARGKIIKFLDNNLCIAEYESQELLGVLEQAQKVGVETVIL